MKQRDYRNNIYNRRNIRSYWETVFWYKWEIIIRKYPYLISIFNWGKGVEDHGEISVLD